MKTITFTTYSQLSKDLVQIALKLKQGIYTAKTDKVWLLALVASVTKRFGDDFPNQALQGRYNFYNAKSCYKTAYAIKAYLSK